MTVPVHSALNSTLQYCRRMYIFPLNFKIWLVPFMNMSFKNVCLVDFLAAKNAFSHHIFHIQYNHMEKRKAKKNYQFLSTFIILQKRLLGLSCMYACLPVCLSAQNNLVPTGWILWNLMY